MAGLTLLTQLWWLVALSVGGKYGLPILQVTETVRETASATSAIEVFRGLGYLVLLRRRQSGAVLRGLAHRLHAVTRVIAVSFAVPLACVLGGWWSRFRERAFFVGLTVARLAHVDDRVRRAGPIADRLGVRVDESPLRAVLSLRNTQRAAACSSCSASPASAPRRSPRCCAATRVSGLSPALVARRRAARVLVAVERGPDRRPRDERPEAIPQPWIDAAHYLDRVGGRAMLVPGIDFATYRWGNTLDPVARRPQPHRS